MQCQTEGCCKKAYEDQDYCLDCLQKQDHMARVEAHALRIRQMQASLIEEEEQERIRTALKDCQSLVDSQERFQINRPRHEKISLKPGLISDKPQATKQTCSFKGCAKTARKNERGYCIWHWNHLLAGLTLMPIPASRPEICEIEGCDNPEKSTGFCSKHLHQLRRYSQIIAEEPCSTPGCSNTRLAEKDICHNCLKHMQLGWTNHSSARAQPNKLPDDDENSKKSLIAGNGDICRYEGCQCRRKKNGQTHGLCPWHRYRDLLGLSLEPKPEQVSVNYICDWPGCVRHGSECGFCPPHVNMIRRLEKEYREDVLIKEALRKKTTPPSANPPDRRLDERTIRVCRLPGCRFPVHLKASDLGLCGGCLTTYRRWLNQTQTPGSKAVDIEPFVVSVFETIRDEQK